MGERRIQIIFSTVGANDLVAYEVKLVVFEEEIDRQRWLQRKVSGENFLIFLRGLSDWFEDNLGQLQIDSGQLKIEFIKGDSGQKLLPDYFFEVCEGAIRDRLATMFNLKFI